MKNKSFHYFKAKKILMLCSFFLLLTSLIAQSGAPNTLDTKGKKQGYWEKYDVNNFLVYTGTFKDDLPIDTIRYYYNTKNPILKCMMIFKKGGKESFAYMLHANSKLMGKGKFVNQKKDSVWSFYDEEAVLISKETYKNGLKNGCLSIYYRSGKLYSETNYKDSLMDGNWKEYFDDGSIKLSGWYSKGKLEGKMTYYFPNGSIAAQGYYLRGAKNRAWLYYKSNGDIENKEIYDKGNLLKGKEAEEFLIRPIIQEKQEQKKIQKNNTTVNKKKPVQKK